MLNTDRFMPAESADIICAAVRAVESEPKMKIAAGKKAKPERKTKPAKKTGKKKKM